MSAIQIQLKGFEQLDWKLGVLPAEAQRARSLSLKRVALLLRDTAVKYVQAGHPDHPDVQTGRLKASFRYTPTSPETEVYVGSDAEYAPYVEFGHSQQAGRFVPKLGKRLKAASVKPYPFFRPALAEVFDGGSAMKLIESTIKEALGL